MFKSASFEDIRNWAANHPIEVSALLGGALGGTAGAVVPTDGDVRKRLRNALIGAAGGAGVGALGSAATVGLVRPALDEKYKQELSAEKYKQGFNAAMEEVNRPHRMSELFGIRSK